MKKYIIPLLISILCLMLLMNSTSNVYAWGPISHAGMISEAVNLCGKSTEAYRLISGNDKFFWEGVMFPDVTVLHYYTTFTSYQNTHTWGFYTALWSKASTSNSDQAKAFALGVGTHLLQDAIVHNKYIPEKIQQYFTQNAIIHPLVEAQIEGKFATVGADWYSLASTEKAQNSFLKILVDKFTDSADLAAYNPAEFAIKIGLGFTEGSQDWITYIQDTGNFTSILNGGSFYSEKGYSTSGELWGIYKAGGAIIQNFVNIADVQIYKDQTVNQTVAWYNSGNYNDAPKNFVPTKLNDPTGIDSINIANSYVMTWYIFGFICFAVIITIWSYRRKIFSSPKLKLNL